MLTFSQKCISHPQYYQLLSNAYKWARFNKNCKKEKKLVFDTNIVGNFNASNLHIKTYKTVDIDAIKHIAREGWHNSSKNFMLRYSFCIIFIFLKEHKGWPKYLKNIFYHSLILFLLSSSALFLSLITFVTKCLW